MLTVKEKGLLLNIVKHCKRIESKMVHHCRCYSDHYIDDECFNYIVDIAEILKYIG